MAPFVPDRMKAPREPGHRFVTSDGTALHVVDSGTRDADVTVVLLHAWTLDLTSWDRVAAALPVRVLRYDHRGHGGSAANGPYRFDRLADDLAEVLEERVPTGRIVLAGHSMGGMTMMAFAERHPSFLSRVSGTAFVATSCGELPAVHKAEELVGRWFSRRAAVGFARTMPVGLRLMLFGRRASWADVVAGSAMIGRCAGPAFVDFRGEVAAHSRREALAALAGIPSVVLAGGADLLTPVRHARAIAKELPGAELVIYPGAGHMVPMERSTEVADRISRLI
jgi:pimeloyl-ACP methyl ester carboxylesterase